MSLRTLKFGDRTISYDAGLNSLPSGVELQMKEEASVTAVETSMSDEGCPNDDGIGSSDDETVASNDDKRSHDGEENNSDDGTSQRRPKKVIRPDQSALDQLLAFDEEEEDDFEVEEEEQAEDVEKSSHHTEGRWHKTIMKDLACLSVPSSSSSLNRRHSISVCSRKTSTDSSSSSSNHSSADQDVVMPSLLPENSLNVSQIHTTLQRELMDSNGGASLSSQLQTLDLRLDEVAHIRSVLTKVELEGLPIDGNVREDVERGKVCFLCMKTKFGLFSRGQKCEMCKQIVCHRCYTKMKIPLEHFSHMPVFALSPNAQPVFHHHVASGINQDPPQSLYVPVKEKRLSVADSLGLSNSVGSAPNSPKSEGRSRKPSVPTISGGVATTTTAPISLQVSNPKHGKFATLPKKARRMSWVTSRDSKREQLEGSLLTVCTDCKEMVIQVIRTSRTTKRLQMVRSMFLNNSPAIACEQRL